jgi:hypothetical protein
MLDLGLAPQAAFAHSQKLRTYSNKVGYVAIFLKEFGVSRLLKKKEYPRYHKKNVGSGVFRKALDPTE